MTSVMKKGLQDLETCEQLILVKDAIASKLVEIENSSRKDELLAIPVNISYIDLTDESFLYLSNLGYTILINGSFGIILIK